MDVSGKKALVFGGTSGIGLSTTHQLAERGAQVVAISRDPSKAGDLPKGVSCEACDVRDRDAMEKLFKQHAPFDILISAATGGDRALGPFLDMDMDGFAGSFDKLWGYANVVRYGASHLTEHGSIVLVSGSPARKAKPGQIALSAVGGAVEAMVRALAPEIAPRRINTVSPGTIDTPMSALEGKARDEHFTKLTAPHLLPRAGLPDEVAKAIVFMVENDFVTGTTIDVDGGWLLGK